MATLLHISDLHMGWPYIPAVGEAVLRLADEVAPSATIVSGDLVQRGDFEALWKEAAAFLKRLRKPHLVIPGNHDIPLWNPFRRFLAPFRLYRKHIQEDLDPILHVPGAVIAGISTPRSWTVDLGFVSSGQLARAGAALRTAPPGALRVVTLHHPPLAQPEVGFFRHHVRGHTRAIAALNDMGADVVLSGHNHYPKIVQFRRASGRASFVYAQAGTACSRRYKPESGCVTNAVNLIRARGREVEVEVRHYDEAAGKFMPGEVLRFERGR